MGTIDERIQSLIIGRARANRKSRIDQRVELDSLEIFANEGQSGVGTELVGKLFDYEIGHVIAHLLGERHFTLNCLIYKDKFTTI
ncbi:MAG: hypothetical protein NT123_25410 [Proteobacteria bacterium]|nr:hypothetical protein [Pseudomonadota bacterium]